MRDKWKYKIGVGITEEKLSGLKNHPSPMAYPEILFGEGGINKFSWGQGRENGDLGAVAP